MGDLLGQAARHLRSMWMHRWLGVAVAWVVAALGVVVVLNIPDKYMATARIYVDTQSILKPLMADLAVQPNVDQQVAMLSQTLINRPNVEKLIRMADLEGDRETGLSKDELADRIIKNLEIKTTSVENLYTLSYRDPDPEKAKRVVQSVASFLVETRLGNNRKDSAAAKKFIDSQIRLYEQKLQEAEIRLKEFKLRHINLRPADIKSGVDPLSDISAQLDRARLDLREAESSRDVLQRQIVGEGLAKGSPDSLIALPELDARIDAQEKKLDSLLQDYTEQHPDVVGTRRLIKELEERRRKEIAERKKAAAAGSGAASTSGDSGHQPLKVPYAEAEAKVASLRARVAEYEARYRQITQVMKEEPQVEAEFAQLNRDYDVHKKNYEALVARRESANLAGELESGPGVDDLRLIDPPRVSPKPVAPNRLLLLPLALLLGLGAGGISSIAAGQLRPVVMDIYSLRDVSGLPLLGCISLVDGGVFEQQERSDLKRFWVALGSLIGAFSIGLPVLYVMSRTAV